MSRWFRFYDDAMNDPKLLRLSDELFRAWTILLCFASKNGGTLPPTDDIALALRLRPTKVAEWITKLVKGGLLDNNDGVFSPHNWNARQFKSDVSTERVKRFRNGKRNVSETASETPPEAEQNRTEAEQSARVAIDRVEVDLSQDVAKAFLAAGREQPALSRVAVWLSKGYSPSLVIDVVREGLARKPDVASLNYFDSALAERHAKRAETPSERAAASAAIDFDKIVSLYARTGVWSKYAGPEPGQTGCRASAEMLERHGLAPDGQKLRKVS
jgi:hypothetical protein